MKKQERIPVFYDEIEHAGAMRSGYEVASIFNEAVAELQTIIKKPIEDYNAFRQNVLDYSIETIKKTFPKPFELGLDNEATFKMLSIDLTNLKRLSQIIATTPHRFIVCDKTGKASACEDKEPHTYYAETPEHFERLKFCNEIIRITEKAYSLNENQNKGSLITGFRSYVFIDPQKGLIPNWHFVLKGIN